VTQIGRTWTGFLVAPAVPAILLYLWGLFRGYGNAAVVGPLLMVPFAYAFALVIGGPVYMFLRRKGVHSLGIYVGLGAAIGLAGMLLLSGAQVLSGSASRDYANAVLSSARSDFVVALIYAAVASGVFWLIAVRPRGIP
jgi:hypothetical protein